MYFSSNKNLYFYILLLCKLPTDYHNFSTYYCVKISNETIQFKIIRITSTNKLLPYKHKEPHVYLFIPNNIVKDKKQFQS